MKKPAHPVACLLTLEERQRAAAVVYENERGGELRHYDENYRRYCPMGVALGERTRPANVYALTLLPRERAGKLGYDTVLAVVNDFVYRADNGMKPEDVPVLLGVGPNGEDVLTDVIPISVVRAV